MSQPLEVPGPGGRIIKVYCINDSEVRPIRDLGITRDGTPTGQRQMIMRMMSATTRMANGAEIATFALAEPPTKSWGPRDPLDRALKDFSGNWQTPGPEWMAERQRRIDEAKAKMASMDARVRDMAQASLADQLGKLVQTTARDINKGAR